MSRSARFYIFTLVGGVLSIFISYLMMSGFFFSKLPALPFFIHLKFILANAIDVEIFMFPLTTLVWWISLSERRPERPGGYPKSMAYTRLWLIFIGGLVTAGAASAFQYWLVGEWGALVAILFLKNIGNDILISILIKNMLCSIILSLMMWRVSQVLYPLRKQSLQDDVGDYSI